MRTNSRSPLAHTVRLLAAGLVTVAALAGCGSGSTPTSTQPSAAQASAAENRLAKEPVSEILKHTASALEQVKGYRISLAMTMQSAPHTRMLFGGDVYNAHAFSLSFNQNGLGANIVLNGVTADMEAGYKFWAHYTHNDTISWMLRNKWFRAPEVSVAQFEKAGRAFAPSSMGRCMSGLTRGVGVVGRTTIDGQSAVVLGDVMHRSDHDTLAIAASGPPYPLRLTIAGTQTAGASLGGPTPQGCNTSSSSGPTWVGTVSFADFNQVGSLQLPRHVIPDLRAYVVSLVS